MLCYKKTFWTKLSFFNNPLPFHQDYLYADIFPMHYIASFEKFIEDVCSTLLHNQQIEKVLNKELFLKHNSFYKESEVRIRLSFMLKEFYQFYSTTFVAQDFHNNRINDFETFSEKCLEYFKAVRLFYKIKLESHPNIRNNNYFYLKIPRKTLISDLVDNIKLSNKISDADKEQVLRLANQENVKVEMDSF